MPDQTAHAHNCTSSNPQRKKPVKNLIAAKHSRKHARKDHKKEKRGWASRQLESEPKKERQHLIIEVRHYFDNGMSNLKAPAPNTPPKSKKRISISTVASPASKSSLY